MKVFLFIFTLIFVIYCQNPPPSHASCQIPSDYSGFIDQIIMIPENNEIAAVIGEVYYSQTQRMVRVDIYENIVKYNQVNSSNEYILSVWQDFNSGIEYIYYRQIDTCIAVNVPYPLGPGQLPPDAEYGGTILTGSQAIHEYYYNARSNGVDYFIEVGLMDGTCIPFNVDIFNTDNQGNPTNLVLAEGFFNPVPMVPPYVLDIPSKCPIQLSSKEIPVSPRLSGLVESIRLRTSLLHSF